MVKKQDGGDQLQHFQHFTYCKILNKHHRARQIRDSPFKKVETREYQREVQYRLYVVFVLSILRGAGLFRDTNRLVVRGIPLSRTRSHFRITPPPMFYVVFTLSPSHHGSVRLLPAAPFWSFTLPSPLPYWAQIFKLYRSLGVDSKNSIPGGLVWKIRLPYTVQTMDLNLSCIRRIPKMHSWIESKIMLRLFLCVLGLFLPPNFTLCQSGKFMLSCHQAGRDMAPVRIPNETKNMYKMFRE
jgi:hypothetical protein